jgi:conjugative relaxase-like TrwC/TraI family protein
VLTLPRIDAGRAGYYEGYAADRGAGADSDSDSAPVRNGGYEGYVSGRHDSESGRCADARPGRWAGDLVASLGVSGALKYGELMAVLEQRHPVTGEQLGRQVSDRVRQGPDGRQQTLSVRAGWDAQFAPVKSVSVLWAVGDADVSRHVEQAMDDAVAAGLRYLQDHAAFTRVGAGGIERIKADGLVAATYRHDTSRSGDPQYHVHCVIANLTHADGRWLRLDESALNAHRHAADQVFQAELRAQLTERLGVDWTPGHTPGTYEIAGISRAVIDELSQRRAQIIERVGLDASPAAKEAAALHTRAVKGAPQDPAALRDGWLARAAEHGLGHAEVVGLTDRTVRYARPPTSELADRLAGPTGVTYQQSVFNRPNVIAELAKALPAGAHPQDLAEATERFVARKDVELVEHACAEGRRTLAGGDRFTTTDILDRERALLDVAERGVHAGAAQVDPERVDQVLTQRPQLAGEQANLVRWLTTSGRRVDVVRAAPGTGKTTALDAAREAWQGAGIPVYGTALSARAAAELEAHAGITSTTVAQLRQDAGHGRGGLERRCVIVVDEPGMVGTRDLEWLAAQADRGDAKLVLVGDTRQLPEIEAGGALRSLADRLGAAELLTIRRQHEAWDRAAVEAFHRGDPNRWLGAQIEHGRVTVSATAPLAHHAVVDGWWRDVQDHGISSTLMLADRRDAVRALNHQARERMREAGRLGDRELNAAGRAFAEGDQVITLCNHRGLGVRNGDRGEVHEVNEDRSLTIRIADRDVRVPADYLEAGQVDHGYAATVHKTQGATLDRVHYLGSHDTYQEAALVAGSRHRDDFRLYVVDTDLPNHTSETKRPRWQDDLTRLLGKSRAEELATDIRNRAGTLRDKPTPELHDEADKIRAHVDRYANALAETDRVISTARLSEIHARHMRETANQDRSRGARRAADTLERTAQQQHAEADRATARAAALTDRFANATVELAARDAEIERRATPPHVEREIVARRDPDLRDGLEERLGPRPAGLADRETWDRDATRQLTRAPLDRGRDSPDAPDLTFREPPDLHRGLPDIGRDPPSFGL